MCSHFTLLPAPTTMQWPELPESPLQFRIRFLQEHQTKNLSSCWSPALPLNLFPEPMYNLIHRFHRKFTQHFRHQTVPRPFFIIYPRAFNTLSTVTFCFCGALRHVLSLLTTSVNFNTSPPTKIAPLMQDSSAKRGRTNKLSSLRCCQDYRSPTRVEEGKRRSKRVVRSWLIQCGSPLTPQLCK